MPLPDDFSPAEHLQDTLIRVVNPLVSHEFRDIIADGFDFKDISDGRRSLATACYHVEGDAIDMTVIRLLLFYLGVRKGKDLQQPIYGLPIDGYQISRKFKPQIFLYFLERTQFGEGVHKPVDGTIRFRLMNEESETISLADMTTLANKIKAEFGVGGGYLWRKGHTMCTYTDNAKGYKLQLLCRDATEGRRLISSVLELRGHIPDWKLSNVNNNQEPIEAYPTTPPTKTILGKQEKQPLVRPIAEVRFRYALLHLHGLRKPICLYDLTRRFDKAIVS